VRGFFPVRSLARLAALFVGGCFVLAAVGVFVVGIAAVAFGDSWGYSLNESVQILIVSVLLAAIGLGAVVAAVALIPYGRDGAPSPGIDHG